MMYLLRMTLRPSHTKLLLSHRSLLFLTFMQPLLLLLRTMTLLTRIVLLHTQLLLPPTMYQQRRNPILLSHQKNNKRWQFKTRRIEEIHTETKKKKRKPKKKKKI